MSITTPFNFKKWIEENRHLLKPPIGNHQLWRESAGDFIVMVVGGPNARRDFHYNEGEEFFYQLEGDVVLRIMENGSPKDIEIREGDLFLLPPKIPHSPRRPANTVGLVIERKRKPEEKDGLIWYCDNCQHKLYDEYFQLEDIVAQMKSLITKFYDSEELRTCDECGTTMEVPA